MFIRKLLIKSVVSLGVALAFLVNAILPACAQGQPNSALLTPVSVPMLIGVEVFPDKPFNLEFTVSNTGKVEDKPDQQDSQRLIEYFLAGLTIPEDHLWVNLSPFEAERILPDDFAKTRAGVDMLAQDYNLKKLTASLMNPENATGKKLWDQIYKRAHDKFGTTDISYQALNKVWIVPKKILIREKDNTARVVSSRLAVMLDKDYLALKQGAGQNIEETVEVDQLIREIVLPEIEETVNNSPDFIVLRQIINSLALAEWYKRTIAGGVLQKQYVNRSKVRGIDKATKSDKDDLYGSYVATYQKGAFGFIKEDFDAITQEVIPRKYYSGGIIPDFKNSLFTDFAQGADSAMSEPEQRVKVVLDHSQSLFDKVNLPAYVYWDVTEHCNFGCESCFNLSVRTMGLVKGKQMDFEESKQMVDYLYAHGVRVISISGGEPFLMKYMPELIEYVKQKGMSITLYTNGLKWVDRQTGQIDREALKRILPNISFLGISYDLYHVAEFEKFKLLNHYKGSYAKYIEELVTAIADIKPDLTVQFITVVGKVFDRGRELSERELIDTLVAFGKTLDPVFGKLPNVRWKVNRYLYDKKHMRPEQARLLMPEEQFQRVLGEFNRRYGDRYFYDDESPAPFSFLLVFPDGSFGTNGESGSREVIGDFRTKAFSAEPKVLDKILANSLQTYVDVGRVDILVEDERVRLGGLSPDGMFNAIQKRRKNLTAMEPKTNEINLRISALDVIEYELLARHGNSIQDPQRLRIDQSLPTYFGKVQRITDREDIYVQLMNAIKNDFEDETWLNDITSYDFEGEVRWLVVGAQGQAYEYVIKGKQVQRVDGEREKLAKAIRQAVGRNEIINITSYELNGLKRWVTLGEGSHEFSITNGKVKEIFDGLGAALAREYGSHRWIINLKGVPFKNEVRFVSMGCCGLAFEFAVRDGRVVRVPADDEVIAQQMRKKHTGYIFDLTPMVVNRKTRWISAGGFYDKKRSEAFEYMLDESSGKFVEVGPSQELLAGLLRKDFNGNQLSSMKFYDQGGRGHVVAVGSEASVHEYVYSPDERMMTRVIRGGSKSLGEASRSTIRESEIRKFIEVPTRNAGRRFLVMTMANEAVNVFGQDRDDAAKSSSDDAMISDAGLLGAKGGVDFNLTKVDFEVQKPESSPFYTGRIHMQSADGSTAIASIVPIILEATPVQQR